MKAIILFKNTFLFFFVTVFTGLSFVCNAQSKSKAESQKSKDHQTEIQTGADQPEIYLPLLKDKKVGVLTNQTGIIKLISNGGRNHHVKSSNYNSRFTNLSATILFSLNV